MALFVPPFGVFEMADLFSTAGAFDAVLDAVATSYPQGNCDSPRPETSRRLLDSTRDGFLSPLAAQLLIRGCGGARPPPEELVNYASFHGVYHRFMRNRANQPDPIFPQSPGIILGL